MDLNSVFYMILFLFDYMKYCGVVILFRGEWVYVWFVIGLLGLEIVFEEVMSWVFGDFLKEGIVFKIVYDFYCGGNFCRIGRKFYKFFISMVFVFLF